MAMTAAQKRNTTIAVILVLALLIFAGTAIAAGPEEPEIPPPPDCPEGKKAVWRRFTRAEWLARGKTGPVGEWQCVDVEDPQDPAKECPEGFHFDADAGDCVADEPGGPEAPQECPPGKVWDAEARQCVDIVPQCDPGFHYDAEQGECVPDFVIPLPGQPEEPPEDPGDYVKPRPTGRSFYQVVQGDRAYGQDQHSIVYRYLLTEGYLAAKEQGASDEDAAEFSKLIAKNAQNRINAWTLITCSGMNDALFGTWGYNPDFDPDPGPHGRAIRLVAQHANNLQRLLNNQPLARCIKLGTAAKKGNGSGVRVNASCHSYELLWMPGINREVLYTSANLSGRTTITTNGMTWPNGDSMGLPPPFITDRGVHFFTGSVSEPIPEKWGCLNVTIEIG